MSRRTLLIGVEIVTPLLMVAARVGLDRERGELLLPAARRRLDRVRRHLGVRALQRGRRAEPAAGSAAGYAIAAVLGIALGVAARAAPDAAPDGHAGGRVPARDPRPGADPVRDPRPRRRERREDLPDRRRLRLPDPAQHDRRRRRASNRRCWTPRASTASARSTGCATSCCRPRRRRSSPACARASSLSLILMVISEMVASSNGIGYFILQSQRSFAITEMWSGILLLGLLGYLFNAVFTLVERRVLAWHFGARAGARSRCSRSSHLSKTYGTGRARHAGDRGPLVRGRGGRVRLHRRPVGLRQDDAAADDRPACSSPPSGTVELDGKRVTGPPEQMALVFQDYSRSLYPWMTVAANVEFPLRRKTIAKRRAPDGGRAGARAPSGSTGSPASTRGSSPAACSSAWRSPAGSPTGPRSC